MQKIIYIQAFQYDAEGISSCFLNHFFSQLWRLIQNSASLQWLNTGHGSTVELVRQEEKSPALFTEPALPIHTATLYINSNNKKDRPLC